MKFIGSMTKVMAVNEVITVPNGEFWKGTIYGHTSAAIEINGSITVGVMSDTILASGTTVANKPRGSGSGVSTLAVLRFSEV